MKRLSLSYGWMLVALLATIAGCDTSKSNPVTVVTPPPPPTPVTTPTTLPPVQPVAPAVTPLVPPTEIVIPSVTPTKKPPVVATAPPTLPPTTPPVENPTTTPATPELALNPPATTPAPTEPPTTTTPESPVTTTPAGPGEEVVKADVGVGIKGRSLDEYEGAVVTPAKAYFTVREKVVFQIQIPQAMQFYEAENGFAPKSHEDFMEKIIVANGIKLPELPVDAKYIYNVEEKELKVVRKRKGPPPVPAPTP